MADARLTIHPTPAPSARSYQLWRWPVGGIAAAIVLAAFTQWIDTSLLDQQSDVPRFLDRGSPESIRSVLSTIAGGTITTLGLVLSITMVTLTLAATQFGPRLVRAFIRAPATKVTIGVYSALYIYTLLVLDSTDTAVPPARSMTPDVGATVCMVGAMGAVVVLIWYVHEVARSIQMSQVIRGIAENLNATILGEGRGREGSTGGGDSDRLETEWAAMLPSVEADAAPITIGRSGYVQALEYGPIRKVATEQGAVVRLVARAGDFLTAGDVVFEVLPAAAGPALRDACERHLDVGPNRTLDQDVEFAIDQLVEIALRALSPAINDTFTGLACLDWLGTALRNLVTLPAHHSIHCDDRGAIRVVERPRSFDGLVTASFAKIRQAAAAGVPAIALRILETIDHLAPLVENPSDRRSLALEAEMCVAQALGGSWVRKDLDALAVRNARIRASLGDVCGPSLI